MSCSLYLLRFIDIAKLRELANSPDVKDKDEIFEEILLSGVSNEPWSALRNSVDKCDLEKVSKIVEKRVRWDPQDRDIKRISHGAIKCRDSEIAKLLINLDQQNHYNSMMAYLRDKEKPSWMTSEIDKQSFNEIQNKAFESLMDYFRDET